MTAEKTIIKLINSYQKVSMGTVNRCKHMPSCSTYSKESIKEQGLIVGGYLTIIRILKCNPFNAPKVDMPLTTMDVDRC